MIYFEKISKGFKNRIVIDDVSLRIEAGKLVVIIGESGSGKTTLLKMINALIRPDSGKIMLGGQDIQLIDMIELRRKIGYVIQQTGLFPHMTVRENIEIIPRLQNIDERALQENTMRLMEMVGLSDGDFLDRFPCELSGGQQQRVGVARAFANDPDIILMDEPFSALDPMTRADLQDELAELNARLNKTIVFVTHDMEEAIKIADMICIMKDGKVLQYDTPENILKNPCDKYVSGFVGKNRIWSSPEFIKISDIMIERPITTTKNLQVFKCLDRMRQHKIDSLLVIDNYTHKLEGIIKASRLRNVENKSDPATLYMETDFPRLSPDNNILDALAIVNKLHISTVPVTDDKNNLCGLVTRSSLVTTLSQQYFPYEEEAI